MALKWVGTTPLHPYNVSETRETGGFTENKEKIKLPSEQRQKNAPERRMVCY